MRSGDEPRHARSPLRLRLVLAVVTIVMAAVGYVVLTEAGAPLWLTLSFATAGLVGAVDVVVVARHIRQGPHFQPGPAVPPYRPVESPPRPRRSAREVPEGVRMRRYLWIMGTCLTLITVAWVFVRPWSTALAVAMSAVAMVLPPIAVIVANFGVRLPDDPASDPDAGSPERRSDPE